MLKNAHWTFPTATLISNIAASFIIGVLSGLSLKGSVSSAQKLLLATGFCGGFSTFSTFSNETLHLFQNGTTTMAIINIAVSVFLCLAATFLGLKLSL